MTVGVSVELEGTSVTLQGHEIVSEINLAIAPGEFVCLLGPSGCGKSTLLNVIAGFVPASGKVLVGGRAISGPGIDRGVVFQSAEVLFPWLTVKQNVEYGPSIRGVGRREREELALGFLRLVGLAHAADKYPPELSGGMRQRVQIARVLANEPSVDPDGRAVRRAGCANPRGAAARGRSHLARDRARPSCSSPTTSARRSFWATASSP